MVCFMVAQACLAGAGSLQVVCSGCHAKQHASGLRTTERLCCCKKVQLPAQRAAALVKHFSSATKQMPALRFRGLARVPVSAAVQWFSCQQCSITALRGTSCADVQWFSCLRSLRVLDCSGCRELQLLESPQACIAAEEARWVP